MKYLIIFIAFLVPPCSPMTKVPPFEWCGLKVAFWGDSFIEGPGAIPLSTQTADKIGWDEAISLPNGVQLAHGNEIVANMGVGGETSKQIAARFYADTLKHTWASVIWIGKNNAVDTLRVRADIDGMIKKLIHGNYVVMGIMLSAYEKERNGTDYHKIVTSFNRSSAKKYGSRYIDPQKILTAAGSEWAKQNDCTPIEYLVYPETDSVHLNTMAYNIISDSLKVIFKSCR